MRSRGWMRTSRVEYIAPRSSISRGKSRQELATLAKTDIGYRYALAHLDPFTVTGTEALSWAPA